jgi:hypothetical protein
MKKARLLSVLGAFLASTTAFAQNGEMQHWDGTITTLLRYAAVGTGSYQRYPGDQLAGAVGLKQIRVVVQDQSKPTSETFALVVRRNDAAGPATGSPDMTAAGVLAFANFANVSFGTTPGAAAGTFTATFPAGGSLPVGATGAAPADDLYVGLEAPAAPTFPADGVSCQLNMTTGADQGEQFRTTFVGYTGIAGRMGLGWLADLSIPAALDAGVAAAAPNGNGAWRIAIRLDQDVLQPFADNPAVFTGGATAGLNPNFGYAGIAPDVVRGDAVGFRLRSNAPVGSPCVLGYDFTTTAPQSIGIDGRLCLNLATAQLWPGALATVAPPAGSAWASQLVFGPIGGLAGLAGLGNVHVQIGTFDGTATGGIRISTVAHINL